MKIESRDDVRFLMAAYVPSAALNTALELGLFWRLAEEPQDAGRVAEALGIPLNRCQYWLDLLGSLGLLEEGSAGYTPSPGAQTAILDEYSQETWALLAQEARERQPAVHDLARHIHEPRSGWAALGLTPLDYYAMLEEDPDRARRFTHMLYEFHQPLAVEVAKTLDMSGVERLMDLGGGSGVISLALLRRHAHLASVVVDFPKVCAVGREIAAENGMEERLTYHAANFLEDELPSGFDMVLECDVGIFHKALFRKLHAVLSPGGRFVIVDDLIEDEGEVAPADLRWAFLRSLGDPDYRMGSWAEIEAQLSQAGFEPLPKQRLSNGHLVLEARRHQ